MALPRSRGGICNISFWAEQYTYYYWTQALIAWHVATVIYNLYFHPLRSFPGPLLQRASVLPWAMQHASGTQAFCTQRLHDKYGPVVRIGPNHLSFTDPAAWKDINGHHVGGGRAGEMAKSPTFVRAIRNIPTSIINSDREEHSLLRRALSHGFSDASMREQEPIIIKYVDLLLQRLAETCAVDGGGDGGSKKALNLEAWYNWTTFDIVGDLVFGQSFRCLESIEYHPWIAFIFKAIQSGAYMIVLNYIGLGFVVQAVFRLGGLFSLRKIKKYTDDMLTSRLQMEKGRDDLFEGLIKKQEEWVCESHVPRRMQSRTLIFGTRVSPIKS